MERTQIEKTMTAVLLAVVTTAGCGARRSRLVAWRPADVTAPEGEADARGARTYRVALPATGAGERPLRAELVFAAPLGGAELDVLGVGPRRPLLGQTPASGDRVVVPLGDAPITEVEVVLHGPGSAAPSLRTARVATEMAISWPAALGARSREGAR